MNIVERAKEFAYNKHNLPSESQRYGTEPYSKHIDDVYNVGVRYLYYIDDEYHDDVKCALRLHDTIEDTDTSPRILLELFNDTIADIVFRVTNERGYDRKEKNFKTYPKIWVSNLAIFVKLSDRIANTKNSKDDGHRMFTVYKKEYAIFRYALKVRNLYPDMWKELDKLNDYVEI